MILKIYIKKKIYNKSTPTNIDINLWIKIIIKKYTNIHLTITTNKEIVLINKKYRKIKKETNVLTFTYNKKNSNNKLIGDIIISNNTIEKEAHELKTNSTKHWKHIILHGILHLLQYNHETKKSNTVMTKLEKQIIKSLK